MSDDKNYWRKCAICGKYIYVKDIRDGRKTVSIEMHKYLKFDDYGYIIPEYYHVSAHRKYYTKQKKKEKAVYIYGAIIQNRIWIDILWRLHTNTQIV